MHFVDNVGPDQHAYFEGWSQDCSKVRWLFSQSPHHEGVMKITIFLSVNNGNLGAIAVWHLKGSKLPLNKGFKNMFELLQSCAQPSICAV